MDITSEKKYTISNMSEEDYWLLISSLEAIFQQWEQVEPPLQQNVKNRIVKFRKQLRCHALENNNITKE